MVEILLKEDGDKLLQETGDFFLLEPLILLVAISKEIYMNEENITSAKLTAVDNGSIYYQMSADTGSNWEDVVNGEFHTFQSTGQTLKWKASSTGGASISSIEIEY